MNSTNRAANRFLLAVVGLVLLAAGAGGTALGVVPQLASGWRSTASALGRAAPSWLADPVIGRASIAVLVVVGVALVLTLLLLLFIARQGRGRAATALQADGEHGAVRIDLAVPRALLEQHLADRDELLSVRVSAYEVAGAPMLKVSVRCRRGASPTAVAALIGRAVTTMEQILGADVPTFVQISGGLRTRTAAAARLT